MTMTHVPQIEIEQGLLVHHDLRELIARLTEEGIGHGAVIAGLASCANELIAERYGQAIAAAWFLGQAKNAARAIPGPRD
jgi:urease accessory protein UreF